MRPLAALSALAVFLVLASAASGAGPWLGVMTDDPGVAVPNAAVEYVATATGSSTTVLARRSNNGVTLASAKVPGRWGLPLVTFNGDVGGLSPNGRVLVLAEPYSGAGELRASTAFTIFRTEPLGVRTTVKIRGDFGFDALSPDGSTLFLIQHASQKDLLSYQVRAYDLRAGKLLPGVIADRRQESWVMNGMPVARATSTDGRWVYTLYSGSDNYPFVHALDTRTRTAVCVGLPWQWAKAGSEISSSDLRLSGERLVVAGAHGFGTRFALDTRTFKVTRL